MRAPIRFRRSSPVWHMLGYGVALGALALLLAWMDWRHAIHRWSTEFYVLCVALVFAALGTWLGHRLTARPRAAEFARNTAALAALNISARELEVLEELAAGASNKAIARRLGISPNTVKTHLARLFEKLEASSRTQAIARARALALLP